MRHLVPGTVLANYGRPIGIRSLLADFALFAVLSTNIVSSGISAGARIGITDISTGHGIKRCIRVPFRHPCASMCHCARILIEIVVGAILIMQPLHHFPGHSIIADPLPPRLNGHRYHRDTWHPWMHQTNTSPCDRHRNSRRSRHAPSCRSTSRNTPIFLHWN